MVDNFPKIIQKISTFKMVTRSLDDVIKNTTSSFFFQDCKIIWFLFIKLCVQKCSHFIVFIKCNLRYLILKTVKVWEKVAKFLGKISFRDSGCKIIKNFFNIGFNSRFLRFCHFEIIQLEVFKVHISSVEKSWNLAHTPSVFKNI